MVIVWAPQVRSPPLRYAGTYGLRANDSLDFSERCTFSVSHGDNL
jgi:hypothetical protein